MTTSEFSNEWDVLVNSHPDVIKMGLQDRLAFNEYEKSVYLTLSQEQIVIGAYNGSFIPEGFETKEEVRRYLAHLVTNATYSTKVTGKTGVSPKSIFYELDQYVWFRIYESVKLADGQDICDSETPVLVKVVTHDEYYKISRNPFKKDNTRRVLRLDYGENDIVELISDYEIDSYYVRFLMRPSPILLDDFYEAQMSIGQNMFQQGCDLHEALHRPILINAVNQAISSRMLTYSKENNNNN